MKTVLRMAILSMSCLILVIAVSKIAAGSADGLFAGRVLILDKKPPTYFNSKDGFTGFLRKHSIKTVYENSSREWAFETMAFFKKPLNDYEVEMVFYDIRGGRESNRRRFVDSFTLYTQNRLARSLSGKTKLIRPQFDANIDYMVVAKSRNTDLAKGEFTTRGTSQAMIDQQLRIEHEQQEMEKSMRELEQKAKEQEEQQKKSDQKAAQDLF